jgi:hypothetical protein
MLGKKSAPQKIANKAIRNAGGKRIVGKNRFSATKAVKNMKKGK